MNGRVRPRPVDALSVFFLSSLLVLTLVFNGRVHGARVLALRYAGAAMLVLLSAYMRHRRPESRLCRYLNVFMPIFIVLFTFDSLAGLTHSVNPVDKDAQLAALDLAIFGTHPGVWMERIISPALTTILQICYTSYYFLPIALGLILYFTDSEKNFDRAVFGIVLGFFASYVGYLAVPALGPRFQISGVFTADLMRGPVAKGINDTLNMLEGENRDAFPSGHTEMVLIVLYYAWRLKRWYFWLALPLVAGLIFSTVYLRYHYAVDVLAGVALAPVCVILAEWLFSKYYREQAISHAISSG